MSEGRIAGLMAKFKGGKKPKDEDGYSDFDDSGDAEELDEDFSASDNEIPVQANDKDDEDYSINDDDFAISSSFKKSPLLANPGA